MEKCKWFNNSLAATVLMIDDLSYGYMNIVNSGMNTQSDWGYGCRESEGIFSYFENNFIKKYPEVKYTVFLPFSKHSIGLVNTKYDKDINDIYANRKFVEMLKYIILNGNEIAYHGHNHGKISPTIEPTTWCKEYEQYQTEEYKEIIRSDLEKFYREIGVKITGGKSPGYLYDDKVIKIINDIGFKWWVFDCNTNVYRHSYKSNVLNLPANMRGGIFKKKSSIIKKIFRDYIIERKIETLIRKSALLSIQEHFLSTRPDGIRQQPNIFDDINSLDKIYSLLRGLDIWYATCSEVAHYIDSYDFSEINKLDNRSFELKYKGKWAEPFLSIKSKKEKIKSDNNDEIISGVYKQGYWIYNNLKEGVYQEI